MKTLRNSAKVACVAIMCAVMAFPITGCKVSDSQIRADGAAIAQAVQSIANLEQQQGNTALAQQLSAAAQALQAATSNYSSGSTLAIINSSAGALEVALAAIPATAAYAPLVPIAIGAIDILVADLGGTVQTKPTANPRLMQLKMQAATSVHHRMMRSPEGDFKSAWNDTVTSHNLPDSLKVK